MRSITESIARIRVYLRDNNAQAWTDAEIKSQMADATDRIGDMLLRYPNVQRQLRTCGPVIPMVNYQQDYPLQADCKEIQVVECRVDTNQYSLLTCGTPASVDYTVWAGYTSASFAWYVDGRTVYVYNLSLAGATSMSDVASKIQTAFRAASTGTETIEWVTDHFEMHGYTDCGYMTAVPAPGGGTTDLAATMKGTASTGTIAYTTPLTDWNVLNRADPPSYAGVNVSAIAIAYPPNGTGFGFSGFRWCAADQPGYFRIWPLPSVTNMLIRTRYLKTPTMPPNDAMGWPGLPNGFDTLIEYYVASAMGLQELEDNKPINDYGSMFEGQFKVYCNAWMGLDRPQRQYVKTVQGGWGNG